MKILHFSDTHLGYSELDKIGSSGINLREQDFYDSFTQVIDEALRIKPDVISHSGDFFHRPSPANRPMIFALEQLIRISEAGIPFVVIAGNHETPKTVYTSPILKAFRTIKGVYPIFSQYYETVELGDLVVHGLPHINDDKVLREEMDKINPDENKFNIMMLHTSIGKEYLMEEYGEQLYPKERLELLNKFDYVALGHWHNFQKISKLKNGWYSGSTERMSDTEAGKEKGYCILNLEKGKICEPDFFPIKAREWYRLDIKKCNEKELEELELELKEFVEKTDIKEALLSIYFKDIKVSQSIQLTNRHIHELMPDAAHIHVKRKFKDDYDNSIGMQQQTESLDDLLTNFIADEYPDEKIAKPLIEKAKLYFDLFETGEYRNR